MNLATTAGEDLSDHLKYFTEHLPATFVFAGININSGGLFTCGCRILCHLMRAGRIRELGLPS